MSNTAKVSEDKQWQIETDAKTLVEAEMIKQDSKRFNAAVQQIKYENKARKSAITK